MSKLLSLCMIVKNEEKTLRRCLESVKDIVDEIIIVDTGSTDTTKAIASEYTSLVFDFEWINDFAAARNESIRRATGRWILWLDADEYIQKEQNGQLRHYLSHLDHPSNATGIVLPILSYIGATEVESNSFVESNSVRIFLNHHNLFFKGAIHEQVSSNGDPIRYINHAFYIYHTGYTNQVNQEKNKSTRNLQIFEELQRKNQLNSPYDFFTLANEYSKIKDYRKALYYYEKSHRKCKENNYWIPHCFDRMIIIYNELKRYKEAFEITEVCLKRWPDFTDFYTIKGLLIETFGYYKKSQNLLEKSIQLAEEHEASDQKYWLIHLDYGKLMPYRKLTEIYYKQRNITKTVFALTKVLNIDPKNCYSLYQLAHLLAQREAETDVSSFLEKLYPNKEKANCLLLFQTFLLLGYPTLCQYYYTLCIEREIQLSNADLLRYNLIMKNQSQFVSLIKKTNFATEIFETQKSALLGALTWNDILFLDPLLESADPEITKLHALGRILLDDSANDLSNEEDLLYIILTDLFNIQSFEAYDLLVKRCITPSLINKLGHYFYKQNYVEMAMEYYSILIDNNELDVVGYINLAMLHLYEGDPQEGLRFLAQAIELEPEHMPLYGIWLEHCTDADLNQKYKKQFDSYFPGYRSIPVS
ncbi:glycosyltransferase family 2 protein [Paenibacillus elgii]|uniref:glycosyltransferase family 2 protein n=1 Tax=Paenibacillus elgii TaxID=189691 RepID=UPI0013CF423B|nr:glycosyltransferase family 2 protein [Paenibacillus elgii]